MICYESGVMAREEKLKTLKEIIPNIYDGVGEAYFGSDLRAEAVKWVKNCCPNIQLFRDEDGIITSASHCCFACGRMMNFFNLTSEDLR